MSEFHNGLLLVGDVLEKIKEIPDNSVDVCLSSPPYWNLRDYGIPGQWGLEKDFHEYLDKLNMLMDEIKRILKPTGTCWINLGDTYSTQSGGMRDMAAGKKNDYGKLDYESNEDYAKSLKITQNPTKFRDKTRIGIPERFYINCIDRDWIARNHIPWVKANAMPTSVKDRFQNKWESIFFFAKNPKYWFNLDAVREKPLSEGYRPFNRRVRDAKKLQQMGLDGAMPAARASQEEMDNYDENDPNKNNWGENNHQPDGRSNFGTGNDIKKNMETAAKRKMAEVPGQTEQGIHRNRDEGKPDWAYEDKGSQGQAISLKERMAKARRVDGLEHDSCLNDPKGKNPGDVFFINPRPFVEAHFATFPPELPEKIIRCAVPEKVCVKCGVPVINLMEITEKVGEKTCKCNAGFEPGVVFDPFMGSGTVALVALQNNRRWLGIEINPEYVEIIKKRVKPKENLSMDVFT